MRPAEEILDELRHLGETLAEFPAELPGDTGAGLMYRTLLERQSELREQLAAALAGEHQPALRLFLDGRPVSGNTVVAGFLGKALEELQASVQALGAAMLGRVGERGLLASRVVDETQLRVTRLIPGSFGLLLEAPLGPVQQSMLTDETDLSLVEKAAESLIDVFELGSSTGKDEQLLEALGGLGVRPVSQLREFADLIRNSEATMRLEFRSPDVPERAIDMDRTQIERLADHLSQVEAQESTFTVTGWLGGASKIRGRFELEADGRLYTGTAASDVIDTMERFFNRRCEADLVVTVTRSLTSGKRSERYYLVALRLARP